MDILFSLLFGLAVVDLIAYAKTKRTGWLWATFTIMVCIVLSSPIKWGAMHTFWILAAFTVLVIVAILSNESTPESSKKAVHGIAVPVAVIFAGIVLLGWGASVIEKVLEEVESGSIPAEMPSAPEAPTSDEPTVQLAYHGSKANPVASTLQYCNAMKKSRIITHLGLPLKQGELMHFPLEPGDEIVFPVSFPTRRGINATYRFPLPDIASVEAIEDLNQNGRIDGGDKVTKYTYKEGLPLDVERHQVWLKISNLKRPFTLSVIYLPDELGQELRAYYRNTNFVHGLEAAGVPQSTIK